MKMLYSHREAYAEMTHRERIVHNVLWTLYQPLSRFALAQRAWRRYKMTWRRYSVR